MKKGALKFALILCLCFSFFAIRPCDSSVHADAPISIASVQNLSQLTTNPNGNFILSSDITFPETWQPINFSGILDGNNKTVTIAGLGLFDTLSNATIKNLHIVWNVESAEDIVSNIGAVAGRAIGTEISQIKVDIKPSEEHVTEVDMSLEDTFHAGGLVGTMSGGSQITDCEIRSDVQINIIQTNSDAIACYVGGVVGKIAESSIKNVVCDLNLALNHSEENINTKLCLGGIAGFVEGSKTVITNYVGRNYLSSLTPEKVDIGLFVGQVTEISNQIPVLSQGGYLKKLVSCITESSVPTNRLSAIGKTLIYALEENEYKVYEHINNYSQQNTFVNFSNIASEWDFKKVWKESTTLISLQRYTLFNISVDDSVNSYGLTSALRPATKVLDISLDGAGLSEGFAYGSTATISATYNTIGGTATDYSFFFSIGRLMLNGQPVDLQKSFDGQSGEYSWTISNINAQWVGEYSIELVPLVYSIRVEPTEVSQGKVRNYLVANDGFTLANISYGGSYTVYSLPEKYFASDGWKVSGTDVSEAVQLSNTTLGFTFSDADAFTKTYLVDKVDEEGLLTTINAKFTASFCTLVFDVELDGQNINEETQIKIVVNGRQIDLDNNKTFSEKVALGPVSVSIENLPDLTKYTYELDGWTSTEVTSFSFTAEGGDASTTKHYCIKLTTIEDTKDNSWIWWLVGGIGAALIISAIIVIIVVKKKEDNSYRNLY